MLSKAYVEITNRCNLSCAFCPGTRRTPHDMSAEEFARLAPEVRQVTRFVYLHLMGEPLLHPELPQILDIAHRNDLRVILTTNGTLLSDCAQLLLAHPAVHKVNISLHSFEANSGISPDDYVRTCAAFAKEAQKSGILCCLRLWNLDGETAGLRSLNDSILRLLHELFPEPWTQTYRGETLSKGVFLEWGERFEWPDLDSADRGSVGFCHALRDQVGILCDGTVVPCCLDHEGELALGNAFHEPLIQILNSERARAIYDGFSRRVRAADLCRRCGYAERFSK